MGQGVTFRIGSFQVQTPLGARTDFETQPRQKTPSDLGVETCKICSD